jgi:hypothetical protein
LVSECIQDQGASEHSLPLVSAKISLVFKDAVVVTIKQVDLALAMAEQHMAAPSEYQVLLALRFVVGRSLGVDSCAEPRLVQGAPRLTNTTVSEVLRKLLPVGFSKSQRRRTRVLDLLGLHNECVDAPACLEGSTSLHEFQRKCSSGNSQYDQSRCLSTFAYAKSCACQNKNNQAGLPASSASTVLVLCRAAEAEAFSYLGDVHNVLTTWQYGNESKKLKKKVSKPSKLYRRAWVIPHAPTSGVGSMGIFPALAITLLQHFAYHQTLFCSIDKLPK